MNDERIAGKWRQFSGALRECWGKLTGNRRRIDEGKRDQLAGRALERYGVNKELAQRQLDEFVQRNRRWNITSR